MSADDLLPELELGELRSRPGTKWAKARDGIAAWVADMDFPPAPAVLGALRGVIERGDLGYPDWGAPPMSTPVAPLFASMMGERYGWHFPAEEVREFDDVLQCVRTAIIHLTAPGDGIVLHTPAYPPFVESVEPLGRRLVAVPAVRANGRYAYDYDALRAQLRARPARLLLLCHPQNPTGHVFGTDELRVLAEIAVEHDLLVVSDEIHADLTFAPARHVPFAAAHPGVGERTVTVTSATKAFNFASLRHAVAHVGIDALREVYDGKPTHYFGARNLFGVTATVAAWTLGAPWLEAVLQRLQRNRSLLSEGLAARLPGIGLVPPEATYLAWLDCRALRRVGADGDAAALFRAHGLELHDGHRFGPGGAGHVRLNFATSEAILVAMLDAMVAAATTD